MKLVDTKICFYSTHLEWIGAERLANTIDGDIGNWKESSLNSLTLNQVGYAASLAPSASLCCVSYLSGFVA